MLENPFEYSRGFFLANILEFGMNIQKKTLLLWNVFKYVCGLFYKPNAAFTFST